ncbi:hypothetical protein MIR68_006296 [Amoeboaphelidium protococcarum]|nr:hypothetical protein MIR68_006296 [Amoeboaphelidium protococcarum]
MSTSSSYRTIQKKSQLCKFIQEDYESGVKYNVKFSGSKDLNGDQVIIVDLNDDLKPQEFYLILEIASELHKHNNSDHGVVGDNTGTFIDGVQVQQQQQQQQQLKITMIFDCENLTASYGINVANYFDHIRQLNRKYPHCINVCMFVNMNWIVKGFFSVLPTSNNSNGLNMNRVKFISNYDDITEYIDPSQVPIKYGGYHHLPYDDNADYYQFVMRQLMEISALKEMVERIQQDQSGLPLNEIQESPPSTDNLLLVSSSSSTAAAAALYHSGDVVESLALSNGLKNAYSLFDSMHQDSEDEYVDCRDDAISVMSREQQYHTARSFRNKVSFHPDEDLQDGDDDNDVQLQAGGKIGGRYKNTLNKIKNWFWIIIRLVQNSLISNLTSQLSFKEKFLALLISLVVLRCIYPKQN